MLQFLQPAGLLAIAGIIFPVIIHLWNKREGKTLKIGSVSLLVETARQQARSLRIKDIVLLLLRCLIIIVLAGLLAKPIWQKQLNTKDKKGWVVLAERNRIETYGTFKPFIDSLLSAGLELHSFEKGFPSIKLEDTLKNKADTAAENRTYWTALKALNEQVPANLPVYLFTDNRLSHFSGTRPPVALDLHWATFTPKDTAAGYLVNAHLSSSDSVVATMGRSNADGTSYTSTTVSLQHPAPGFQLKQQADDLFISNTASSVQVDNAVRKIIIYTDRFSTDAGYLKAALEAIKAFGKYNLQIADVTTADSIPANFDWLFWLSPKEVPAISQKNNVFRYGSGKEKRVYSTLQIGNEIATDREAVSLYRRIDKDSTDTFKETIWSDGFGNPVLNLEEKGSAVYHFYSRFDPAWNDLVWRGQFPQVLFNLMLKKDGLTDPNDKRMITAGQLQPTIVPQKGYRKQNFIETTDLSKAAWTLTFLLFCLERGISLTRKKEAYA